MKPEEPVSREDSLLIYRYGRWSNLVAARRGDRPRLVKPGEKLHVEATGETLEEYYTKDKLLDALEAVGERKRGIVEQSLRERLAGGDPPDPRRK